ncbi:N protein [Bat paramyxovirus]|nr:N protein [Bat paramyxovirus]
MSSLFKSLQEFKEFKNTPVRTTVLHGALNGIRKKVIILSPSDFNPTHRWELLKLLIQLIWSAQSSGSVVTGSVISLLTIFAEQPSQLLRTLMDDPDLEGHIIETVLAQNGDLKFSARGLDMSDQEGRYKAIAQAGPEGKGPVDPFINNKTFDFEIRTTEEIQRAISTVTIQVWILLTKAVTAPDTAKDSETKRWIKYLQQKRVDDFYRLKNGWLDLVRNQISEDISIRRLMVSILIAINKSTGTKGRLLESIADIGNYIAEAGMASFFLTIKYGIETKLPALALNEFQGDLSTMITLMKTYKEQGDRAPYLTILEDSIQTRFAPGNYALLWSFAMGVGVALDRSMNGLNFNRPFLEPNYFRLGQDAITRMEGNVDTKMATDLGLTSDQITQLRQMVRDEGPQSTSYIPKSRAVDLTTAIGSQDAAEATRLETPRTTNQLHSAPTPAPRRLENLEKEREILADRMRQIIKNAARGIPPDSTPIYSPELPPLLKSPAQSTNDLDVMNSV